jgi:hypothetical protein
MYGLFALIRRQISTQMNLHIIPQSFKRICYRLLGKLSLFIEIPVSGQSSSVDMRHMAEIRMVTNHDSLISAIACIKSFYKTARVQIPCYIHVDLSVNKIDRLLLKYCLPQVTIVTYDRPKYTNRQNDPLNKLRSSWQGQKLIQMIKASTAEKILILDSDILFLHRPDELLEWITSGKDNIFMEDIGNFSVFSEGEYRYYFHLKKIPEHINTGIMGIIRKSNLLNLTKLSEFIRIAPSIINQRLFPGYEKYYIESNYHVIEQAGFVYLLSLMASSQKQKTYTLLPKHRYQLFARLPEGNTRNGIVAIHYAGPTDIKMRLFEDYFKYVSFHRESHI